MTIELDREILITLSEATKKLPCRPHISTLHRWRIRGVRGVKLETVLVGGRRFTTLAALEEFIERTTLAANDGGCVTAVSHTSRHRRREIERAERSFDGQATK